MRRPVGIFLVRFFRPSTLTFAGRETPAGVRGGDNQTSKAVFGLSSEDRSGAGDRRATWGRIVLGDVLAKHGVEIRGRARVWPWR